MQEKENIIMILKQVKESILSKDVVKIKELSNHTLHSASIYQDEDSIAVAVIAYTIGKLIERTRYQGYKSWDKFVSKIIQILEKAVYYAEINDDESFREKLEELNQVISKLEEHFKRHVQEVFAKARINKASRIYEHGVSMERTSKLLGISVFELAEYAGTTGISENYYGNTLPVKKRIKIALEMFEK